MADSSQDTRGWALKLTREAAVAAQALRLEAGVEVGEATDVVWLRGRRDDEGLHQKLRTLPALERYIWRGDGRLRPQGSLLATEVLPELAWAPIRAWGRVELPPARLPAGLPLRASLLLVPGHVGVASNALLLDFTVWRDWALTAPAARLEKLIFAVAGAGLVLVRGTPMPAAPGRHFVETQGVLLPAGFGCEPTVSANVIRWVCGAGEGESVLWDEAGVRILGCELFMRATRASVRATARALEMEAGG